jgi:hypothetical protein
MAELAVLTAVAGLLAALLANIGIWAPRRLWVKVAAIVAAAAFLPVAYAGLAELLGRPKPMGLEWAGRDLNGAAVLGVQMRDGDAIYLWLGFEGVAEPRSYVLPWDDKTARELHEATRTAEENGTDVRMQLQFESSLDQQQPRFYASPQAQLPPKTTPPDNPVWFQRPETGPGKGPS